MMCGSLLLGLMHLNRLLWELNACRGACLPFGDKTVYWKGNKSSGMAFVGLIWVNHFPDLCPSSWNFHCFPKFYLLPGTKHWTQKPMGDILYSNITYPYCNILEIYFFNLWFLIEEKRENLEKLCRTFGSIKCIIYIYMCFYYIYISHTDRYIYISVCEFLKWSR